MTLITDIQKLEPGGEVVLFELDGSDFGADVVRFHGHAIPHSLQELAAAGAKADQLPAKPIWWQGHEYAAWPADRGHRGEQRWYCGAAELHRRQRQWPDYGALPGVRGPAPVPPHHPDDAGEISGRVELPGGNPDADPSQRSSKSGTWTRKPTRTASTWPGNWPRQVTLAASRSVGR